MLNKLAFPVGAFAVALSLAAVSPQKAEAATLNVVGGAASVLPAGYSLGGAGYDALAGGVGAIGSSMTVFDGASKTVGNGLKLDGSAKVVFTFLGSEAGGTNVLSIGGGVLFDNKGFGVGYASGAIPVSDGFLPFEIVNNGLAAFANADLADAGVRLGFSQLFNGGSSVLVFFDGDNPDVDFDDMVFRVDVTAIPAPPAVLALGSAMIGFILLSYRKSRRAA